MNTCAQNKDDDREQATRAGCDDYGSQRLRFAITAAGRPRLLFLDEPTAAMDVHSRQHFWRALGAKADAGTTVLFATHYLEEAHDFADRIVVISAGRLVADGDASAQRLPDRRAGARAGRRGRLPCQRGRPPDRVGLP
jgi:ABC-type sulfate/molybdate transport systems ATPase subunit